MNMYRFVTNQGPITVKSPDFVAALATLKIRCPQVVVCAVKQPGQRIRLWDES